MIEYSQHLTLFIVIEECQGGQGGLPNLGSFLAGIKSFFDFTINIIYKDVRF